MACGGLTIALSDQEELERVFQSEKNLASKLGKDEDVRQMAMDAGFDQNDPRIIAVVRRAGLDYLKGERASVAQEPGAPKRRRRKKLKMPKSPGRPRKGSSPQDEGLRLYRAFRNRESHKFKRLRDAVKAGDADKAAALEVDINASLAQEAKAQGINLYEKGKNSDKTVTNKRAAFHHAQNLVFNQFADAGLGRVKGETGTQAGAEPPAGPPAPRPGGRPSAGKGRGSKSKTDKLARKEAVDDEETEVTFTGRGARLRDRVKEWDVEDRKGRMTAASARVARRQGPVGAFVGILRVLNERARFVALLGLSLGILFIPMGFFTFSGWSIAALAMVIISTFYLLILNGVKAFASLIVNAVNAFFTFLGTVVVKGTELVLRGFGKDAQDCFGESGELIAYSEFCNGHQMVAQGLVTAGELKAIDISLLDPNELKPSMDTTPLIQRVMKWFEIDVDLGSFYAKVLGSRFTDFVEGGNIYVVMATFLIPTIVILGLGYFKLVRPAMVAGGVASSGS